MIKASEKALCAQTIHAGASATLFRYETTEGGIEQIFFDRNIALGQMASGGKRDPVGRVTKAVRAVKRKERYEGMQNALVDNFGDKMGKWAKRYIDERKPLCRGHNVLRIENTPGNGDGAGKLCCELCAEKAIQDVARRSMTNVQGGMSNSKTVLDTSVAERQLKETEEEEKQQKRETAAATAAARKEEAEDKAAAKRQVATAVEAALILPNSALGRWGEQSRFRLEAVTTALAGHAKQKVTATTTEAQKSINRGRACVEELTALKTVAAKEAKLAAAAAKAAAKAAKAAAKGDLFKRAAGLAIKAIEKKGTTKDKEKRLETILKALVDGQLALAAGGAGEA